MLYTLYIADTQYSTWNFFFQEEDYTLIANEVTVAITNYVMHLEQFYLCLWKFKISKKGYGCKWTWETIQLYT